MLLRGGGGVVSSTSRLLLRPALRRTPTARPELLLRQLPAVLPHFHYRHQHHNCYPRNFSTAAGGLSSFETSTNDGRYEQDVQVVRVDRDGTTGQQTTSVKELLLSTEVHVSTHLTALSHATEKLLVHHCMSTK